MGNWMILALIVLGKLATQNGSLTIIVVNLSTDIYVGVLGPEIGAVEGPEKTEVSFLRAFGSGKFHEPNTGTISASDSSEYVFGFIQLARIP